MRCRPVTDFAAPLILLPAQLGGNNIGVLAASLFPRAQDSNTANHKHENASRPRRVTLAVDASTFQRRPYQRK